MGGQSFYVYLRSLKVTLLFYIIYANTYIGNPHVAWKDDSVGKVHATRI